MKECKKGCENCEFSNDGDILYLGKVYTTHLVLNELSSSFSELFPIKYYKIGHSEEWCKMHSKFYHYDRLEAAFEKHNIEGLIGYFISIIKAYTEYQNILMQPEDCIYPRKCTNPWSHAFNDLEFLEYEKIKTKVIDFLNTLQSLKKYNKNEKTKQKKEIRSAIIKNKDVVQKAMEKDKLVKDIPQIIPAGIPQH